MLVKMEPEAVARQWAVISESITRSLPPITTNDPKYLTNIMKSIMLKKTHCWVSTRVENENVMVYGIVVTTITNDPATGAKALLIYSVYSFTNTPQELWLEGIKVLKEFARGNNCIKILGFTDKPSLLSYYKAMGANVDTHLIQVEVT